MASSGRGMKGIVARLPHRRYSCVMRPLRYSINVTLDGCCDHRAFIPDEDLHRHAVENRESGKGLSMGGVKLPLALAVRLPTHQFREMVPLGAHVKDRFGDEFSSIRDRDQRGCHALFSSLRAFD